MNPGSISEEFIRAIRKRDERLFQALVLVSFPVFLLIVTASRLVNGAPDVKRDVSIMAEAKESARSTIAIALSD